MGYSKVCNHPELPTTIHNHSQPSTTIPNYPQPSTTTHNHPQLSTTTHNHPQPPTTLHNHLQPTATSHNHPQPPTTIHNDPQPPNNYLKKPRLSQTVMLLRFRCWYWNRRWVLLVIRNNGIYTCVCVSVWMYPTSHYIDNFLVRLVVCFCQR